jgi:aryl-alcohol dehydrogenase-like predicted oxidoreductase
MKGAAGLVLGTAQWGLTYGIANRTGRPTEADVSAMIRLASEAGVTTLDTARAYGDSEVVIGKLLGDASAWTVVTKLDPEAYSPKLARRSVADSRSSLRRHRLDVLLLHRINQRMATGVWDVLRRERDAGRIGRLGISALNPDQAWAALDDQDVNCIQVATSLFDQRLSRAGFFEIAVAKRKQIYVRSVFLQGIAYLTPDALPAHLAPLRESLASTHEWASGRGVRLGLAFLGFAARLTGVQVLIGCETVEQISANLVDWEMTDQISDAVVPLAGAIPDLPDAVLNPADWPAAA